MAGTSGLNGIASSAPRRELEHSPAPGWRGLVRDVFRGGLAGVVAGVVFIGVGSRIVMRLSALLNPSSEGAVTENGNIVGEITFAGTAELVVGLGVFSGLMVGGVWVLVRDWLPPKLLPRVVLAGVLAAGLGSFAAVTAENRDFRILDPAALNVGMFVLIIGLAGSAAAILDRLLEGVLPHGRIWLIFYATLAAAAGLVTVPLLLQLFFIEDVCGCKSPPRLAGTFLIIAALATLLSWSRYFARPAFLAQRQPALQRTGAGSVVAAFLFGVFDLINETSDIL